jgi:hypothetical protein
MKTIHQLIKDNCVNYDFNGPWGIHHFCCLELEKTKFQCGYFIDELENTYRCAYLEKCVLPGDKQIEAVYRAEVEARKENRELSVKEKKEIKEKNKIEDKKKMKRKRRIKFED